MGKDSRNENKLSERLDLNKQYQRTQNIKALESTIKMGHTSLFNANDVRYHVC